MPELNNSQFRVRYPTHHQLELPFEGSENLNTGPEQMRMFDTHRAGPANVYAANPSMDTADWGDQDREVPLSDEGREMVDDEEFTLSGEFFQFPVGQADREFMAYGGAHQEKLTETKDVGTYLGHDAYPGRTNPGMQFGDLTPEADGDDYRGEASQSYFTDEGTEVGRVQWHDDEWGPNVDYAEINPLYRGRGFSREAIAGFAEDRSMEGEGGIVHAGSYTAAGSGAFHAKGIPTIDDIEHGYDDWVGGLDPDDEFVRDVAAARYPEEDWNSPNAPQSFLDEIREEARGEMRDDPDNRMMFRENLEDMQSQVLANLPGRRGAFAQGWKPKFPTRGFNDEFPGMPQKYTGGRA